MFYDQLPRASPYAHAALCRAKDSRRSICKFLELFLCVAPSSPVLSLQIPAASASLNTGFCLSSSTQLLCSPGVLLPCSTIPHRLPGRELGSHSGHCFFSLRHHTSALPIVQHLKTVGTGILTRFLVVCSTSTSLVPVTPSWLEARVIDQISEPPAY